VKLYTLPPPPCGDEGVRGEGEEGANEDRLKDMQGG